MGFDSEAGVTVLELEGEVFSGFTAEAVGALRPFVAAAGVVVRRVIDLGCGPGVAACDLTKLFESVLVVAADASASMLERATVRAVRLGCAAQVEPRQIDLNRDVRSLGSCDVVYASMSLHHVHDEVATLGQIRSMLEPHGLLCVLERADPPVVRLSEEGGRPGIWNRLEVAWQRWFEDKRSDIPGATRAKMYPSMLAAAGLDVMVDETVGVIVDLSGDDVARKFAARHLQRAHVELVRYAEAADLKVLPDLVRAISVSSEQGWDGAIHATRKLFIAAPARRSGTMPNWSV